MTQDDASTVGALLARGFDSNSLDEKGQTGLVLALRDDRDKVAEALASNPETHIDQPNSHGETPLMMAALHGRADWVRRLLERGAGVNRPGWTPLHYAATGPDSALVGLLLERGAKIDSRSPNGTTPLMMAARYGSEASALLLLDRGADPKLRNDRQLSAGDFARLAGRDKLALKLDAAAR